MRFDVLRRKPHDSGTSFFSILLKPAFLKKDVIEKKHINENTLHVCCSDLPLPLTTTTHHLNGYVAMATPHIHDEWRYGTEFSRGFDDFFISQIEPPIQVDTGV